MEIRSFAAGFQMEGRPPLEPAVKQVSTVGSPYDLAVEIAMIRNTASSAVLAVIRSFIAGCSDTEFHML